MADERSGLKVRLVADDEIGWYNALMAEHHALGVAASGRVLRYVAEMNGVPLVLGTFGSAAWRVPVRDEFIGWDPVQQRRAAGAGGVEPAAVRAAGRGAGAARGIPGAGGGVAPPAL